MSASEGRTNVKVETIFEVARQEVEALRSRRVRQDEIFDQLRRDVKTLQPALDESQSRPREGWGLRSVRFYPRLCDYVVDPLSSAAQSSIVIQFTGPDSKAQIAEIAIDIDGDEIKCSVHTGFGESMLIDRVIYRDVDSARRWLARSLLPYLDRSLELERRAPGAKENELHI